MSAFGIPSPLAGAGGPKRRMRGRAASASRRAPCGATPHPRPLSRKGQRGGAYCHETSLRHRARRRHEQDQPHRLVAHAAADLCRPPAALQRGLPRGRGHSGLAEPCRSRRIRSRVARADRQQSAARLHGPRLLSPLRNRVQSRRIDEAVGINSVERFLGDLAIEKGWAFDKPGRETGKRVLVVGAGPAGLSAAYHLRAPRP